MNNNPTIARLLAKENLTVQHGNYKTAWFDIKNRILGLPLWKDMGKDVYDLFIGHEIGHALYTPYEGWHDSPEKIEGVPRSYLNVVEDARIEKFARRDYPGLVGPFLRGYADLVERDFFGSLDDLDWEQIKLIDKINLKAKLGLGIEVPFISEEKNLFDKVMSTETFEEVVELCKEILAYTKENTPELITKPEPEPEPEEGSLNPEDEYSLPEGHDDYETPEASGDSTSKQEASKNGKDTVPVTEEADDKDVDRSDEKSKKKSTKNSSTDKDKEENLTDEDRSLTDDLQRKSERELIDLDEFGNQSQFARLPCKELIDNSIVSFEKLTEQRNKTMLETEFNIKDSGIMEGFEEYMIGVKKSARFAIKEFELRKAAYQWQRAATAKTGSLDMNKVHSYKYNEEIFARVTKLANAKNHGMIMLIDYSGSMGMTICQVIDQLFHLVTFCKGVNIPFDVYAFTTGTRLTDEQLYLYRDGDLNLEHMSLPLIISSSLKKGQYDEALKFLYMKKQANSPRPHYDDQWWSDYTFNGKSEEWGSTPLNNALLVSHTLIKKFKARHNLDKMNLIVLSDGDSNHLRIWNNKALDAIKLPLQKSWRGGMTVQVDGKLLRLKDVSRRATTQILESLRKRHQINTIGFFVSQQAYDWRSKLNEIHAEWVDLKKFNMEYKKNKCITMKNKLGYNEFYLVKGGKDFSADTSEEDFRVKEEASNVQIRTAFKKFSKNKKLNKVLMTNFGRAVA